MTLFLRLEDVRITGSYVLGMLDWVTITYPIILEWLGDIDDITLFLFYKRQPFFNSAWVFLNRKSFSASNSLNLFLFFPLTWSIITDIITDTYITTTDVTTITTNVATTSTTTCTTNSLLQLILLLLLQLQLLLLLLLLLSLVTENKKIRLR